MELCDHTLEEKIKMQEGFDNIKACIEFCSGLDVEFSLFKEITNASVILPISIISG